MFSDIIIISLKKLTHAYARESDLGNINVTRVSLFSSFRQGMVYTSIVFQVLQLN